MQRERVDSAAAEAITGLALRTVQAMAARGELPGAAKMGKVWTFDERRLRAWVREREGATCPTISTSATAPGTTAAWSGAPSSDEAYERALS